MYKAYFNIFAHVYQFIIVKLTHIPFYQIKSTVLLKEISNSCKLASHC